VGVQLAAVYKPDQCCVYVSYMYCNAFDAKLFNV
jgi:hypothetical protein